MPGVLLTIWFSEGDPNIEGVKGAIGRPGIACEPEGQRRDSSIARHDKAAALAE